MNLTRRQFAASLAAMAAGSGWAFAQDNGISRATAFAFSFKALDGGDIKLADYSGRPVLVVNTASLCGYTPQYAGLEMLWSRFKGRGLLVLGVPSNDFGGQEPGGASEIHGAADRHGVTFPLTEKVAIKGDQAHPFYRWAAVQRPAETPKWNFHKYLVGRDGTLAGSFGSPVEPTDTRLVLVIEKELRSA